MSLYQQFKNEGKNHSYPNILAYCRQEVQKSQKIYLRMGIDISKEEFWQRGFNLVNDKIEELKEMN